jgi:predicted RNase H-like HicB family nuclease
MAKPKRQFDVVIEKDSDGYLVAWVPALPGCHTQARSHDQLTKRIREAIELCLVITSSDTRTDEPRSFPFTLVKRLASDSFIAS